jgi:NAD(P)-dependent dehydrogenase (short-subunit alcohol dehydrogenase family)
MVSAQELFSLEGKTAIVTGGTSGIGRTVADYLASAGANIAIISRTAADTKRVAGEIFKDYGVKTLGVGCDVTDADGVEAMVNTVADHLGTADVLFNNAGINVWGGALELKYEDWKHIFDVNVNGVFLTARAFAQRLIKDKKQGSVINNASMSGSIINLPQFQTAYNTSKAAVIHLTKALAIEWIEHDIRVNAISPGYVWTEMNQEIPKDIRDVWMAATPTHRFAKPDEMAGAVIYLASKASSFTTGAEIIIDGGFTCL